MACPIQSTQAPGVPLPWDTYRGPSRRRPTPEGFKAPIAKPGDWDSYPPWLNMMPPEIFSKFHSRKNGKYPPYEGTHGKNFESKICYWCPTSMAVEMRQAH